MGYTVQSLDGNVYGNWSDFPLSDLLRHVPNKEGVIALGLITVMGGYVKL